MTHDEDRQNLISERENLQEELGTRESDIADLNAEIRELKLQLAEQLSDNEILNNTNVELQLKLKEKLSVKTKKICPFMSQSHVTACRTDCRMWVEGNQHVSGYCVIDKGLGFLQNIGMGIE